MRCGGASTRGSILDQSLSSNLMECEIKTFVTLFVTFRGHSLSTMKNNQSVRNRNSKKLVNFPGERKCEMTLSSTPSMDKQSRDASYWAQPVSTMKVRKAPTGALNLNVDGHQLVGPLQGFGQLWQKTFRVRLSGTSVTPTEVIKTWKENFPEFWPKWDHFYKPVTGIAPGEVGIINMLLPGDIPVGVPISTGVLIIYADDESFTFMNPLGHMFAGWITFSAYEEEACTIAQI